MSARLFLQLLLDDVAAGRVRPAAGADKILAEYPRIDDHEGEKGYWNTADEHGNISGPFDTWDEAIEEGNGHPYWVEDEEDEEEDLSPSDLADLAVRGYRRDEG